MEPASRVSRRCPRWVLFFACTALSTAGGWTAPQPRDFPEHDPRVVWEAAKAYHETTPTRESLSINGLWRWQPASAGAARVPDRGWGFFKVPGSWPGLTDYMQKESQVVHAHASWKERDLGSVTTAWYEREVTVPNGWLGRRTVLRAEYLNSFASVFIDGRHAGVLRFPGGELDVSEACAPGSTHVLSLLVAALPLEQVRLSYDDPAAVLAAMDSVRAAAVRRRGLCGDVDLVSTPRGPRIDDVRVEPSVRSWQLTLDVAIGGLADDSDKAFRLHAKVTDGDQTVREFRSGLFRARDLEAGRIRFTEAWKPGRLWDIHTPGNVYTVSVSLEGDSGQADRAVLDTFFPVRFGFRELWIDGRDFYLNGTRIFLSVVPIDNAQVGAALASYAGARETLERLKDLGINAVYTHNYDCRPGSHLSFTEILTAADDVGMLVSFSQPHFSDYEWGDAKNDSVSEYARHAEFYVRAAENHPSVVFYGMSHNATGYDEDMNPDEIDGLGGFEKPRDSWALNNARRALRAEAIVEGLDPSRIVYHHSSGNLGSMHTSNFYANFVPRQELSDWFEHWATEGAKPVFLCEFGAPLSWDWTMYRGWYQGEREWGSASVPWEFCIAEWNAEFLGDRAYRLSEREKRNLRWEARQFRAGRTWHRWDYPTPVGSSAFDERSHVYAAYFNDVWRAFRTWGVSAVCPWDHGHYWILRDGLERKNTNLDTDWEKLQRPGFSPDFVGEQYERVDLAFERSDWKPTAAGEALIRNNRPVLAYIAGKPSRFTSKDHDFEAGETVEKQLIIINNSRETVTADCEWSLGLPEAQRGEKELTVKTGEQIRVPLRFALPPELAPGTYEIDATVHIGDHVEEDSFSIHVLSVPPALRPKRRIAIFDPKGESREWLGKIGVAARNVDAETDLSPYEVLVVGKGALTVDGPAPDIRRVREGLKVIVFEQTAVVLEKRFGFRVAEYGLREIFKRVPDHPLLDGLDAENLRDWRGEATTSAARLDYELRPRYGPTVRWCDIPVTRLWRCGCYGNVASVLIEKPARGDFLPILDGGFSLQYSPLLEYREGDGVMLFCQVDVTGRTESEPAAERLARNIIAYADTWTPKPRRRAIYAGGPAGRRHLGSAGVTLEPFDAKELTGDDVLVVSPGNKDELSRNRQALAAWLEKDGHLIAIGLDGSESNAFLPFDVTTRSEEYISTYYDPEPVQSPFAGVGPADLHNRDPRELPLVAAGGAARLGNGVLARAKNDAVVFLQLAPWTFLVDQQNTKRVFRGTSRALARLLGNLGVAFSTPLIERFHTPVSHAGEKRWLEGFYLDSPEEWDDPYRFFRW